MGESRKAAAMQASSKRLWHVLRIVMYMVKKGLLEHNPMIDLPHMMKEGSRRAGKTIGDLMSSGPNSGFSCSSGGGVTVVPYAPREYEFSCSNTPAYTFPFHNGSKRNKHLQSQTTATLLSASTRGRRRSSDDELAAATAFQKALEWLNSSDFSRKDPSMTPQASYRLSPVASPYPLRITDSPFPLKDEEDEDHRIDMEAEIFIARFYEQLQSQKRSEARFREMLARGGW